MFLLGRQARDRILRVHQGQRQRFARQIGQATAQQFEGEHADAVQVGAAVDRFAARLFRRHVAAAADGEAGGGDARGVALGQGDTEIRQQRTVGVVEQHVLGLDVAMHDAARMRVLERRQQRTQYFDHAVLVAGEVALAEMAFGQVGQDVVQQALRRASDLMDADDAGVLELGDRARFLFEALLALFVGQRFGRHDLDRHLAVERFLHAQIDIGHAALAYAPKHPVTRDLGHEAGQQGRQFFRRKLFFHGGRQESLGRGLRSISQPGASGNGVRRNGRLSSAVAGRA